jgi:IgA Peptidase M64
MTAADGAVLGTTQILGSAPTNRALNIVLLADGFTAAQQNDFNAACTAFVTSLQTTPPFTGMLTAINVFRVSVSSTDSGADDPASAGGTGATARTYFDSTFGANGIRRLLVCNNTTALQVAAAQVPQFTVVLVVVNSSIYGGSGGSVATYSLAAGATEIALHETGHTAVGLADEYAYYAGGNEPGHDQHPAFEPAEPNVTINSNLGTLKWRWAVAPATGTPTMTNPNCAQVDTRPSPVPAGTVGLFEGAHYYHCGAYRPEHGCKMQALGLPFCRVCGQVISNRVAPLTTQIVAIASAYFGNAYLRLVGSGVTEFAGGGGGMANCQFGSGAWEQFRLRPQPDGTVTIASAAFDNVYLRMDGNAVSQFDADGGGVVNTQFGAAAWEKFRLRPQADGTVAIASAQFPNVYLRMDGSAVTHFQGGGSGVVNCQYGVGAWERFNLITV